MCILRLIPCMLLFVAFNVVMRNRGENKNNHRVDTLNDHSDSTHIETYTLIISKSLSSLSHWSTIFFFIFVKLRLKIFHA